MAITCSMYYCIDFYSGAFFGKPYLLLIPALRYNHILMTQMYVCIYVCTYTQDLTISKSRRTNCSDSPRYLEASVEDDTLKNVVPHSVATALANNVFPVPGGPTINTPFHGLLIPWKYCGIHSGSTTASSSSLLASFRPAISSLCKEWRTSMIYKKHVYLW